MYDDILLPVDGSDPSMAAIPHAVSHAEKYDAKLHVVHVMNYSHTPAASGGVIHGFPESVTRKLEQNAESVIDSVESKLEGADVEVETSIRSGNPPREINKYANEEGIDLIVMGTHGHSGLNRLLMGSVTERVIRTADIPVLSVSEPPES